MGLALPAKRITINLAPADVLKEGSHFDLPIALGLLVAMEILPTEELQNYTALGELSLDGQICKVNGSLPAAISALQKQRHLICPEACGAEAAWAGEDLKILAPDSLSALINHFQGNQLLSRPKPEMNQIQAQHLDMRDIKGQEFAKRALEVAACGGHNLLMMGPPGSGKSMLAARLAGILPPLTPAEALSVTTIHSISGALKEGRLIAERPFRAPHHSASLPALVGGGTKARPGEISLAHSGVLFLDELPEFSRPTLEALRQPLETGSVLISRANHHIEYPADIQLVAAMNPCRCGYLGDAQQNCAKAPICGQDYQSKISGPLYDRLDIQIEVPALTPAELTQPATGDTTAMIAERVSKCRAFQLDRFQRIAAGKELNCNAQADGQILEQICLLNNKAKALMEKAVNRLNLSARGYHRLLRVSRTLADMNFSEEINHTHIAEALTYRRKQLTRT